MGKLKLLIVAFVDLIDLKHPRVAKLNFVYSICNRRLVMCLQNLWWR